MASKQSLVLTTEAARERKIRDGKAVLVEDAGVVLAVTGTTVSIYKEWADGKLAIAGQCAQGPLVVLRVDDSNVELCKRVCVESYLQSHLGPR